MTTFNVQDDPAGSNSQIRSHISIQFAKIIVILLTNSSLDQNFKRLNKPLIYNSDR